MSNKENTRYIYIRSTKERIPCTQEEFDNYYHEIDLYRQRQQYRGMCVCPASKRLDCDMDCATCPFRRAGAFLSLNKTVEDEDGNEIEWGDLMEDSSARFDETYAEVEELQEMLGRLSHLMPEAIQIGELRLQGCSDLEIARRIGIPNTTFLSRIKKVKETLKKEFPKFF